MTGDRDDGTRVSDVERDAAVDALAAATAEGRLTLEELADRSGSALGATTRAELARVTADLPGPVATGSRRGVRWVLGVMGGGDHRGRWRIGTRCTVINLMGGADLDLRQAIVEDRETAIVVVSVMGGSVITVPEGVDVDVGGFAVMGGNDVRIGGPPAPPGAPRIRVRCYSLMGGTDVTTGEGTGRRSGQGTRSSR